MKRAAIIGCGTIFQVHLPIIVANPEIELCAVCDNNPAVQEKLPAAAKAVPFYTDYEELLEKEHPDVVHLCLPHYLHVPVSEYFASHGVNVFCEKPVGLNTAQAKEFVEFEAAHPEVKIGICLQNRLNRTTVELKKSSVAANMARSSAAAALYLGSAARLTMTNSPGAAS